MIAALVPVLVRSFHVSVLMASLLGLIYSAAAVAAHFLSGSLSDHYGRRWFLLGGVLVFAAAAWAASRTQTFAELMAARALTGLAAGTISTCSIAYAGGCFGYQGGAKAIGLVSSACSAE